MNIHTPHRLPDESQADYRARQRRSRAQAQQGLSREMAGGTWRLAGHRVDTRGLGDQRRQPGSRERHRDAQRQNGTLDAGQYGRALVNYLSNTRRTALEATRKGPRDAHGAVTLTGNAYHLTGVQPSSREFVLSAAVGDAGPAVHYVRRIWLAGISAQRGY